LLTSGQDVGTSAVGIPLTQEEMADLDLGGREAIVREASDQVIPLAQRLPGYAGVHQDQRRGGTIVLRFTSLSATARSELAATAGTLPVEITSGSPATFEELHKAASEIWSLWPSVGHGAALYGAGVDEQKSTVVLAVAEDDVLMVESHVAAIESELAVPVDVEPGTRATAQACDTTLPDARAYCYDPMKAGALVYNAGTSGGFCTMGFHVRVSSTVLGFASAGHCSYGSFSDNWYMTNYPGSPGNFVGSVQTGTMLYRAGGQDFMVVRLPSSQASRLIWDASGVATSAYNPVQGSTICMSPGMTDNDLNTGEDCGTVYLATRNWTGDYCNCLTWGADANGISTRVGDSGSPLYGPFEGGYRRALGVHNTAFGGFAKMKDAIEAAGVTMYPYP
jgi:hypothetical protein